MQPELAFCRWGRKAEGGYLGIQHIRFCLPVIWAAILGCTPFKSSQWMGFKATPATGTFSISSVSNNQPAPISSSYFCPSCSVGADWRFVGVADVNGDGQLDLLW